MAHLFLHLFFILIFLSCFRIHQRSCLFESFSNRAMQWRDAGVQGLTSVLCPGHARAEPVRSSPVYQSSLQQARCRWPSGRDGRENNRLANAATAFDSKHKRIPGSRVLATRAEASRRNAWGPEVFSMLPKSTFKRFCTWPAR